MEVQLPNVRRKEEKERVNAENITQMYCGLTVANPKINAVALLQFSIVQSGPVSPCMYLSRTIISINNQSMDFVEI